MKNQPQVLDACWGRRAKVDNRRETAFESTEQFGDDVVLVAKMIVEVAGTDPHLVGDMRGGDVRFARLIEQPQSRLENALSRAPRLFALRHDAIFSRKLARECRGRHAHGQIALDGLAPLAGGKPKLELI